ncbi:MAG: 16S rRNA (guanine(966)-N(2))-methyltransferase RsmD [Polyangiales bacterium]
MQMRVVAGHLRSRPIRAPKGDATRPTSDRVRESLFAVLGDVRGLRVLDLYAGSGALAIEAISRGAALAVCVESHRLASAVIAENAIALGVQHALTNIKKRVGDAARVLLQHGPFDLVFADPPYADVPSGALSRDLRALCAKGSVIFQPDARFVIEHAARDESPKITGLTLVSNRSWGDTRVAFYRLERLDDGDDGDDGDDRGGSDGGDDGGGVDRVGAL